MIRGGLHGTKTVVREPFQSNVYFKVHDGKVSVMTGILFTDMLGAGGVVRLYILFHLHS